MAIYKTSYYIPKSSHPGGIINLEARPEQGTVINIGENQYQVQEAVELIPPQGRFHYFHITCSRVPEPRPN